MAKTTQNEETTIMTTSLEETPEVDNTEAPTVDEPTAGETEEPTEEPTGEPTTEEPTDDNNDTTINADIVDLKKKGFITTVVGPEKLTKENLTTYVTQVGVASKLAETIS